MNIEYQFNSRKDKAYPNMTDDLHSLHLDLPVIDKLSSYLSHLSTGSDINIISPPFKDIDLNLLRSSMDKLIHANRHKLNDILFDLELSQRVKFGPRSIAKSWKERKPSLLKYFEPLSNSILKLEPISDHASLRPLSYAHAVHNLKNSTNSGLPYFTKKSDVKSRLLNDLDKYNNKDMPCILFTRTQEGNKTRDVWGYPVFDTLKEMRYYKPLLEYQKKLAYRKALISPSAVDISISGTINKALRSRDRCLISIDFSSYDATVKSEHHSLAFDYIKSLFQSSFHDEIEILSNRFSNIPILTPDGILRGEHGVPSGSTFTNEVDSIVQATIAANSGVLNLSDSQIQGDDGVYLVNKTDVSVLMKSFRDAGLLVNQDKTVISDSHCIYLQNLYHKDYIHEDGIIRGIYPIYRALNRIVFQERWQNFEDYDLKGQDFYSIRTLSILENCKNHPLFKDFVKLILNYDDYGLSFHSKALSNYIRMVDSTTGSGDFIKHQRGDYLKGIRSFDSYKVVQNMISNKVA